MKAGISEKLVAHIWQHQLITNLVTDAGDQFHIIYPGRVSSDGGCDFRDAVFVAGGRVIKGNIEVHVKSSQWYSHGHHQDPKYNNIVLHVAMWHDTQSSILLQNGATIPTICLGSFLCDSLDEICRLTVSSRYSAFPCPEAIRNPNTEFLKILLSAVGEERFATKASLFQKTLAEEEAGQVLFRGIARALGYAKNTESFEELANRLPLRFLEEIETESSIVKRALILGTAGLLPSQRFRLRHRLIEEGEEEELEMIWQAGSTTETMKETDWCFFRVRPANFPTRRLVALSYLLTRYYKSGLLRGILDLVREAPIGVGYRWLGNGLIVAGQDYWAKHSDFGITRKRGLALLGQEKAAEIVINTILPFVYAWGEAANEPKLEKKAIEIYRHYPRLGDNELSRHMKQQFLLEPNVDLSACQHQGLIHIFKTYCCYRNCTECPVAFNQGQG